MGSINLVMIVALLGAGGGKMPFSMPPLPTDPVMMRVAPQECLFYAATNGSAQPDPASKNQTEQLLAEPEVQEFVTQTETLLTKLFLKQAKSERDKKLAEQLPTLVKMLLTRPAVVYVGKVDIQRQEIRAALVVQAGEEAAELRKIVDIIETEIVANNQGKPAPVEATIGGVKFRQLPTSPGEPEFRWGFKGETLIVTLGAETPDLVARLDDSKAAPPAWLTDLDKRLPVDRPAARVYLNVAGLLSVARPFITDPKAVLALDGLGILNVKAAESVIGLDAEGLTSKVFVSIDGEPTGIFALASAKGLSPTDLATIPHDASMAAVTRLDVADVYQRVFALLEKIEPANTARAKQQLEMAQQQIGINLETDLLAPLGDVWRIYNSSSEGGILWNGIVLEVNVKDRAQLEATLQKALTIFGPMLTQQGIVIKQQPAQGETIHTLASTKNPIPVIPAWCLTKDRLIVTLNPQMISAILTREPDFKPLSTVSAVEREFKDESAPFAITFDETTGGVQGIYSMLQIVTPMINTELMKQGPDLELPILPSYATVVRHVLPHVSTMTRVKDGLLFEDRSSIPVANVGASGGGVMVALLLPAVQAAREAARRNNSINNMKQLALAMHNYHDTHRAFPAPATLDKDKKPLLSWRVQMLPYLEEKSLYDQFHQDEPWDSEHNKQLIAKMPRVFADPSLDDAITNAGKTTYVFPTGKNTLFDDPGRAPSVKTIIDGTSRTLMIVEASPDRAVIWTKPDDIEIDAEHPMAGLGGLHPGIFLAALCDGSVRAISMDVDSTLLKAFFSPRGGEVVGAIE